MICWQTNSICRASSGVKKANLFSLARSCATACSWAREKSGKAPQAMTTEVPASKRDRKSLRESSFIPDLRHRVSEHTILSARTRPNPRQLWRDVAPIEHLSVQEAQRTKVPEMQRKFSP